MVRHAYSQSVFSEKHNYFLDINDAKLHRFPYMP